MLRRLSAVPQEGPRERASPCRLVSAPTLRSIKWALNKAHRCGLTAEAGESLLALLVGACIPGWAARGSISPRKRPAISRRSGYSDGPRAPTRAPAVTQRRLLVRFTTRTLLTSPSVVCVMQ